VSDSDHRVYINCHTHGRRPGAMICQHILSDNAPGREFVETSSDPEDLRGWCDLCEARFEEEGDLTAGFVDFCGAKLICDEHYKLFRSQLPAHEKR